MDWLTTLVDRAHTALLSPSGSSALAYLGSRGVTPEEIDRFHLGYSDLAIHIETCTQAFLDWIPRYWPERLVFPLTDYAGRVIGVQTRSLDRKFYQQFYAYPTEIYPFFFGLGPAFPTIWQTKHVVIVEGVFDCLAVSKVAPNVVATLSAGVGVAAKRFFRRHVSRLTALLDMDGPGRSGCLRLADDIERTYLVTAPAYAAHDPGDMLTHGRISQLARLI